MTTTSANQRFKVLFVDDEEQALKYFRKAYEKEFGVLTAASADAASSLLREQGDDIAILITDQRMPQRTGVDLLQEARRDYPGIVRILTTAYSDLDSAIDAVNSGAIFRYVTKPWDIRELRGVLLRAMDYFHAQRERDLLLCEKLSVLQRMLVLDRARTLTVLGAALEGRLRHPLHAVKAYLDFAATRQELTANPSAAGWDDLWALTVDESETMLRAVPDLLKATEATGFEPLVPAEELKVFAAAVNGDAAVRVHCNTDARIVADRAMLRRLVHFAVAWLHRLGPDSAGVEIRLDHHDQPIGVRVAVTGEGPAWQGEHLLTLLALLGRPSDEGDGFADLLTAFLIVHHHGGRLRVLPDKPAGPGIEFFLPADAQAARPAPLPEDWLDAALTRFEA